MAVAQWAIAGGAPLEAKDKLGATPLLLAVVAGHLGAVKALAAAGADVRTKDRAGYSTLHYAALKDRVTVFRWLCEAGADPLAVNAKGQNVRAGLESRAHQQPQQQPQQGGGGGAGKAGGDPATVAASHMLALLDNALSLPAAPAAPTVVDASSSALVINVRACVGA